MNQNIKVDLIPKFAYGNLYFSQYDVGREAIINLVNGSTKYEIPSGATITLVATKPSGLGFTQNCTFEGNQITVVCTAEMTDEAGRFPCELRIVQGSTILGTANITFNVERSPHPEGTTDGTADSVINQITVALNNALSDIEDAKEEAIETIQEQGGGITQAVKVALLNCFENVAWINENGQTYYDALYNALYDVPAPTLTSISAVYTQSGTVYTTDTLDSLKSDLVVTALWDNQTTTTVTDYTLSGTLTEGTSTITVLYGDKSTTFDVTVTHALTQYTITNNLTQCVNSNTATAINELTSYSGTLTANSGYIMGTVSIMMGNTDITSTAYDSTTGAISIASVTGNIVITAEAVEDVGWISGVPYVFSKVTGEQLGTSGPSARQDYSRTDVLPCSGVSYFTVGCNNSVYFYTYRDGYAGSKYYTFNANNTIKYTPNLHTTLCGASKATNSFPSELVITPYKCDTLAENTVWESGKEYEIPYPQAVVDGTTTDGQYYNTGYLNCLAATNINIFGFTATDFAGSVYFYDANKTQIGNNVSFGYMSAGTSKDVEVPTGAYFFRINGKFKKYGPKGIVTLS